MRLLGGHQPRDELIGQGNQILSRDSSWRVQVNQSGSWLSLIPRSSNFTSLGTNATGTFVRRTMQVGLGTYEGTFIVTYKALSTGRLKWDLEFIPTVLARYRFEFSWANITRSHELVGSLSHFRAEFGTENYTLSWSDVPKSFNSTSLFGSEEFGLDIDLASVTAGNKAYVDPSLVSNSTSSSATAYTFQRKILFEPKGGYYFVFYFDGYNYWYRYSQDGLSWSTPQWQVSNLLNNGIAPPTIFYFAQTIVMATANGNCSGSGQLETCNSAIAYYVGSISGHNISWTYGGGYSFNQYSCTIGNSGGICGIQDVGLSVGSGIAISFNLYKRFYTSPVQCNSQVSVWYPPRQLVNITYDYNCSPAGYPDEMRSALVRSDSAGTIRLVYERYLPSRLGWTKSIGSVWLNTVTNDTFEQLDNNVADSPEFSAVSTPDYQVQIAWRTLPSNTIGYAYRGVSDNSWTLFKNIMSGSASFPTLTADYSTDNVYSFAINSTSILMREKTSHGNWTDTSIISAVNHLFSNAVNLGSNFASASSANSSTLLLVWTTGPSNGNYNVTFASVPIQTVWSAYADPSDPWNGEGVSPYGQYFRNEGESVSPSNGLLTVSQTDLSLAGRGLDLHFTRVYTEPSGFLSGQPYVYENYPWAPLGNGWQLDFPWMSNVTTPQYIHLWNGEGYRIPASFWTNNTSTFENHQGEDFILSHWYLGLGIFNTHLTTKSGITYAFDQSNRLTEYFEITPYYNWVGFSYDSHGRISNITDTVSRLFFFQYNSANLLTKIWEENPSGLNPVNWVNYNYSGQTLTSATDALGRATVYQYQAVSDPTARSWLISRITYPTGWYANYTYASSLLGTDTSVFRVNREFVGFGPGSGTPVRQFVYAYTPGVGDQIISSLVTTYNSTRIVSYTSYMFSFQIVAWNVSDAGHNLVKGVIQHFGVRGEPETETVIVTDASGGSGPPGGYTNYYRYDLWGNLIYSRQIINPLLKWSHEIFNAYDNDGLPSGFNLFQDTFSQTQGTAPDNVWTVRNGAWLVENGQYSGTETSGEQADMIASADVGRADVSIQARVYVNKQLNTTLGALPRVGIFAHYNQTATRSYKWALALVNTASGTYLDLLDDWNQYQVVSSNPCPIIQGWYTFTMSVLGNSTSGTAAPDGHFPCNISGFFPSSSPASGGTGFGLYAGGYSALFDNVTVTPLVPWSANRVIGVSPFSNSFYPAVNLCCPHSIQVPLAGTAELQNGVGSQPLETYYNYTSWGAVSQVKQEYTSSSGTSWITTTKSYDSSGNLVKVIDPRGNYTMYGYSSRYSHAYLTSQAQTLNPENTVITSSFSYNFSMGTRLSSVDPNGHNTSYTYDLLGRITSTTFPTGDYARYKYNDQANYVNITNENGWMTQQSYDGLGRLIGLERFSGGTVFSKESYTLNWNDQVSTKTDPLGNRINYTYDVLGRTIRVTEPNGNATQTLYNDLLSRTVLVDEKGVYTCDFYDRLSRLIGVYENATSTACQNPSAIFEYFYDEIGNLLSIFNFNDGWIRTQYAYDNLNRLAKTTYPDGSTETYAYDSSSNLVTKIDRKGVVTRFAYDSKDRIQTVTTLTNPNIIVTDTFDNNGNPTAIQSTNATILYSYDSRNRVTSETYSINGFFTLSVTPNSVYFFCSRTNCSPTTSSANLTITSINGWSGNISLNYLPPSSGANQTALTGPSSAFLPPSSKINMTVTAWMGKYSGTYPWTIQGQSGGFTALAGYTISEYICTSPTCPTNPTRGASPSSPSQPSGPPGASYTVKYAYTGETLSNITYPDGTLIHYGYDNLGRTISISSIAGPVTTTYASIIFDKNDQPIYISYNNGLHANYTYDSNGRPSAISLVQPGKKSPTTLLSLAYQYSPTGTVSSVMGSMQGQSVSEQYGYDALGEILSGLVTSNSATTTASYHYGWMGNRISQTVNSQTTSYTYNSTNNELKSLTGPGGTTSYSYDADGNLIGSTIGSTTTAYTWDPLGDLLKVASNGHAQGVYAYDGQGRRIESVEACTIFYSYMGTETLSEYNTTSRVNNDYLYAANLRIGKLSSGTINFYHQDALGSTRLVTDPYGNIVFSDGYQPFGQDNGTPSSAQPYRFTGKPVSQTTGLYYEYQRWYDPSIGRFISQDPVAGHLSDPKSLNPYVYVENIPTSYSDPTGMDACGSWGWLVSGGCFVQAWNSQPDWAKYTEIGVGVGAAIVLTAGLAAPELLPGIPLLLAGDVGVFGAGAGVCEEDPAACEPPPPVGPEVCECPPIGGANPGVGEGGGPGGVLPNQIGNQGVKATISSLGKDFIGTEAPVLSENYGFGRIDVASTNKLIEVKNVQNLYLTNENEIQMLKYVDAVGPENLQYDIYANYVSPRFTAALNTLGVDFRIFPYIPLP